VRVFTEESKSKRSLLDDPGTYQLRARLAEFQRSVAWDQSLQRAEVDWAIYEPELLNN
jgi:hypothetical protein